MGTGTATIEPDQDRPHAATLFLDGTPQSYVDLADPTFLCFEYVAHIGAMLDVLLPQQSATPLRLLHLGGGALTIPRYVSTIRPRSQHRVAEIDGPLVDFIRVELPLDPRHHIKVSTADARMLLGRTHAGSMDAVVVDVFAGARVPAELTTTEFFSLAATALRPGGVLLMNFVDRKPLLFARRLTATVAGAFPHLAVAAEPSVWRGRRFGNLVVVARGVELPIAALSTRLAGGPFPARLEHGLGLRTFSTGALPLTDADSVASPEPPPDAFGLSRPPDVSGSSPPAP